MRKAICSIIILGSFFVHGFAMAGTNHPQSAPVTVMNSMSNPVPVQDSAIKIPFQTGFECDNNFQGNGCIAMSDKEIPEGMRFVIEYVTARILVDTGNTVEVYFRVGDLASPTGVRDIHVPANHAGETVTGTLSIFSVSEKILAFADRTDTLPDIMMSLYSPYPVENPRTIIHDALLTGYLVPAP